jgi:hypothetical protein
MSDAGTDLERDERDTSEPGEHESDDSDECEQPDQEQSTPVTGGFTEDVQDGPATCIDPGEASVGVKQRLRLQVPNVYTQLTLGEAVNNVDQQGFSYAGFGAQTAGHVFISAGTSAAPSDAEKDNFMMLHAKSGMSALSPEGSVFLAGRTGVNAVSGGGVTMVGEAGVLIGGGTMGSVFTEDFKHDFDGRTKEHVDPGPPDWAVTQGRVISAIAVGINAIDTAVAFANGRMRSARNEALTPSIDPGEGFAARFASKLDCVGAIASTTGSALDACGAGWPTIAGAPTGVANRASASTVLFGQSGTIVSSPLSVAVYAGPGGAVIGSLGCIDLLSNDSLHAHSGGTVSVSGQDVSILSSNGMELLTANKCILGSRTSSAAVLGSEVVLGTSEPETGQAPTLTLNVGAQTCRIRGAGETEIWARDRVQLHSVSKLDLYGNVTDVTAKVDLNLIGQQVRVTASNGLDIGVGESGIKASASSIQVGRFSEGFKSDLNERRRALAKQMDEIGRQIESLRMRDIMLGIRAVQTSEAGAPIVSENEEKARALDEQLRDVCKDYDAAKELSLSGMKHGVSVNKSSTEVVVDGFKFTMTRDKAKMGKHLVVMK